MAERLVHAEGGFSYAEPPNFLRARHEPYDPLQGYEVAPAAARLPNGLFAANLTIEKASGGPSPRAVSFDAIDFFFEEEHALAYASRWGRLWVDTNA